MNIDWNALLNSALGAGAGTAIVLGIAWRLASKYLSAYVAEKGKNLATKEDITEITDKVEGVKHSYTTLAEELKLQNTMHIEERKARSQLRLAALERRMAAHQEAFKLWRRMWGATNTENAGKVVLECQTWWDENFLYLEPEVRTAFSDAYWALSIHQALLNAVPQHGDPASAIASINENWARIKRFPKVLEEAFSLPALNEAVFDVVGKERPRPLAGVEPVQRE